MKITLAENERVALLKLPVSLRSKLAPLLEWPDLGVDKRGKHWKVKSTAQGPRLYEVKSQLTKARLCTLAEAADAFDLTPAQLEDRLESAKARRFLRGRPSYSTIVGNDEITVTLLPEEKK